jgi:hypothetical protein
MSKEFLYWYIRLLCEQARDPMSAAEREVYRSHRRRVAELLARD